MQRKVRQKTHRLVYLNVSMLVLLAATFGMYLYFVNLHISKQFNFKQVRSSITKVQESNKLLQTQVAEKENELFTPEALNAKKLQTVTQVISLQKDSQVSVR